jgi:Tol biopolymer transport system component
MKYACAFALTLVALLVISPAAGQKRGGGGSAPPADPAIAFVYGGVAVCNADGSNATVIRSVSGKSYGAGPSWSPAGTSIAFLEGGELWRIDVSISGGKPVGSNALRLTPRHVFHPAWSPLGHEIAFVDVNAKTIEVIPAGGGATQVLYQAPSTVNIGSPCWDPTGTKLAFYEGTGTTTLDLKVLDRNTGVAATDLQLGTGWTVRFIDWSRGGDRLAFDLQGYSGGDTNIYTLDLATGTTTQIVNKGFGVSWSPDDSKIAFTADPNGSRKIATVQVANGAITRFKSAGTWPDWRRL